MEQIRIENFKTLIHIIDKDRKDSTYKYALIRGAIEIFQHSDHFKKEDQNFITFPLGLLIERWILYYYPIFESEIFIPQMGADKRRDRREGGKPKFRAAFDPVIDYYRKKGGGFSQFYNDYQKGRIPSEIQNNFLNLCIQIRNTIVDMPMYHLGYSAAKEHNQIFHARKNKPQKSVITRIDPQFLIDNYGEFYVEREYYDAFKNVGPFLIGDNSLLFRWAQFSENRIDNEQIKFGEILKIITNYPIEEREIQESLRFYEHLIKRGIPIRSIWSNKPISTPSERVLAHLVPFSVWKNNDLWNILPALGSENSQKSDRIPHPDLLDMQKDLIIEYWTHMREYAPETFMRQIGYSLIGNNFDSPHWQEQAFVSLKKKCSHMIDVLGYEGWKNK